MGDSFTGSVSAPSAFAARGHGLIVVTDRPLAANGAQWTIRIREHDMLPLSWHTGIAPQRMLGAFGPANALLFMESLRDLRAAVSYMGRDGGVAESLAGMPPGALRLASHHRVELIFAVLPKSTIADVLEGI